MLPIAVCSYSSCSALDSVGVANIEVSSPDGVSNMYAFTAAVSRVCCAAACFLLATARRASIDASWASICARWTVAWSYCSESCANNSCC